MFLPLLIAVITSFISIARLAHHQSSLSSLMSSLGASEPARPADSQPLPPPLQRIPLILRVLSFVASRSLVSALAAKPKAVLRLAATTAAWDEAVHEYGASLIEQRCRALAAASPTRNTFVNFAGRILRYGTERLARFVLHLVFDRGFLIAPPSSPASIPRAGNDSSDNFTIAFWSQAYGHRRERPMILAAQNASHPGVWTALLERLTAPATLSAAITALQSTHHSRRLFIIDWLFLNGANAKGAACELLERAAGAKLPVAKIATSVGLHVACRDGDSALTRLLLQCGIAPGATFHEYHTAGLHCGDSPVHTAARFGQLDCFDILVAEAGPQTAFAVNAYGFTPLHLACQAHKLDMARWLLQSHATPAKLEAARCSSLRRRKRPLHCMTPLHLAAKRGLSDIMQMLLDAGVSQVGETNSHRNSPLHLVAFAFRTDDRPASCAENNRMWVPSYTRNAIRETFAFLSRAARPLPDEAERHALLDAARLLLARADCDVSARNSDALTAAHAAWMSGGEESDMFKLLVSAGSPVVASGVFDSPPVFATNLDGRTAIAEACRRCDADLVRFLLTRGDRLTLDRDRLGITPLVHACANMRVTVPFLEMLLDAARAESVRLGNPALFTAFLNAVDTGTQSRRSALHRLVSMKKATEAALLVRQGCDRGLRAGAKNETAEEMWCRLFGPVTWISW